MKPNKMVPSIVVSAALFISFLTAMFLDVTGLEVHQWLGLAIVVMAIAHLLAHRRWVQVMTHHFLAGATGRGIWMYLVDVVLGAGFLAIAFSGVLISSWLSLGYDYGQYMGWRNIHVVSSVLTLALVVLKVGLHWKWVANTVWRGFPPPVAEDSAGPRSRSGAAMASRPGRRHFLGLMGAVGLAAVVAGGNALVGVLVRPATTQPPETVPASNGHGNTAPLTPEVVTNAPSNSQKGSPSLGSTTSTNTCRVICNRRCAYPGQCRRYTDSNRNQRCDLGECVAQGV
jgi:hypothetical protein